MNFIHDSAIIENGVKLGENTSVWDNVHIRKNAKIGHDCIIGEKSYIAYDVVIGNYVKINAQVYVCAGVTIQDKVMISAGAIFTNDKFPRAFSIEGQGLASSAPNEETQDTLVGEGATICANATIIGGNKIGKYSMVGAGSVVTKSVPAYALYYGNPARFKGWICKCGTKLGEVKQKAACGKCSSSYILKNNILEKIE